LSPLLLLLWLSRRIGGWGRRVSRYGFFGLRFGFSLSLRLCFLLCSGRFNGWSLIGSARPTSRTILSRREALIDFAMLRNEIDTRIERAA
jgi:hypothetical protein